MSQPKVSHWPISILNGLSAMVALFLPMIMSRLISADDIGRYKVLFLYLLTMPALSLTGGIENGLYYWAGLGEDGRPQVRTGWSLTLLLSLIFMVAVIVVSPWLGQWFGWSQGESLAFVIASFTVALANFYEALLIATKRIWPGAFFSAGFDAMKTISLLSAVMYYRTAESAVWAFTVTSLIKIAVTLFFGSREGWIPLIPEFKSIKEVMKYSLPVSVSGIFDLLMNYSDRFLLSVIISPAEYAIYTFGCLSLPPLQILERSVNRVLIPKLTLSIKQHDRQSCIHLYNEAVEQIMMLYIPAVVGLIVFAEPIIRLLFTEKYIAAASFLRLYALWYLVSGWPYDVAARASGDGRWILKTNMIMGAFSLSVCALLTWWLGALGALISLIVSVTMLRFLGFRLMHKKFHWNFKELVPVKSLMLFSTFAVILGIGSFGLKGLFATEFWWLVICGGAFALVYLGVLIYFRRDLFDFHIPIKFWRRKSADTSREK